MSSRNKIYFASDFHLGAPNYETSLKREKQIVAWLDEVKVDAKEIYLVGDIFDFWFEYKSVIPRGFVRLQGKIAEITDSGTPIHIFTGNHDMWIFDYLPKELGVTLHRENTVKEFSGKKFLIGHGDGLGPGETLYKVLKAVFSSKLCQWAFARIHPNFGIGIANAWSRKSRKSNVTYEEVFHGEEKEKLIIFCKDYIKQDPAIDYFIFGHRHLPIVHKIGEKSTYYNLGEWIKFNSYAVFDGEKIEMKEFKKI
jgi:UDP-2,3-diacylglucosamine hydrolase